MRGLQVCRTSPPFVLLDFVVCRLPSCSSALSYVPLCQLAVCPLPSCSSALSYVPFLLLAENPKTLRNVRVYFRGLSYVPSLRAPTPEWGSGSCFSPPHPRTTQDEGAAALPGPPQSLHLDLAQTQAFKPRMGVWARRGKGGLSSNLIYSFCSCFLSFCLVSILLVCVSFCSYSFCSYSFFF